MKNNHLSMTRVCLLVSLHLWGNIIFPSEIQTEMAIFSIWSQNWKKKCVLSSGHWLCPFQRLYAEDIRRCNYLMDQWLLSWHAIDFLNHEVRQSRAEVDQNVSALLGGLFPHVFAGSKQGRINRVEKCLGIFSLQQAEKKNILSVN